MQQIAAHQSDIAALSLTTDSSANSSKSGSFFDEKSQGSEAFKAVYTEAKSSNESTPRQISKSEIQSRNQKDVSSQDKTYEDDERGSIDLPPEKEQIETRGDHSKSDSPRSSKGSADEIDQNSEEIESGGEVTDAELEGIDAEESSSQQAEVGPNLKGVILTDVEAGDVELPPMVPETESPTNWIEYVESLLVTQAGEAEADIEGVEITAGLNEPENTEDHLANLLAQFLGQATESETEVTDTTEDSLLIDQPTRLDTTSDVASEDSELSADEALLLSLLRDELLALQDQEGDGQLTSEDESLIAELASSLKALVTLQEQSEQVDAELAVASQLTEINTTAVQSDDTSSQATNDSIPSSEPVEDGTTHNINEQEISLLQTIAMMSPESAQKATEAFAERLAASVPTSVTSAQQQAVKSSLIASINEFQQQVAQGREPDIDLSAIIADAAAEAGITQSQMQTLAANADALAGQFMLRINDTQRAAQDLVQNQLNHADTHNAENNQVRAESSKSQFQLDGSDKGINVLKPEGQQQLHEKIRWMVNARNSMAEIRLDPPELGSMQVRVNMTGDAASVSFVVQSQHAKDVLADTMPKLKEMLAEQGIALGESEVRKDNSSQNGEESGQQLANNNGNGVSGQDVDDETQVIEQGVTRASKGGIDFYA